MTKPVTRKMAVDCLLWRVIMQFGTPLLDPFGGDPLLPGMPIQFDHIHADVHGGPHEYGNLRPMTVPAHKKKTKADIQANAKVKRLINPRKSKHPMPKSKRKMPSRPFQKRK